MAVIEKKIKLMGSKGEAEIIAIFDSRVTYSCIQPELASKIEIILPLPQPKFFKTAESGRKITAKEAVVLDFILNGYTFSDEFMIIPHLSNPVIIGATTLQKWRVKLDFENKDVIIDPKVTKLRLLELIKSDIFIT